MKRSIEEQLFDELERNLDTDGLEKEHILALGFHLKGNPLDQIKSHLGHRSPAHTRAMIETAQRRLPSTLPPQLSRIIEACRKRTLAA